MAHFISLLYPNAELQAFHENRANLPDISEEVCDELGLNEIFALKSSSLTEFFTSDPEVIRYRQSTLRDLLDIPELLGTLSKIHPILDDIRELRRLDDNKVSAAESYLYSITEIELYVSAVETLKTGFEGVRDRVSGTAFVTLFEFINELCESDYYRELNDKLKALAERVNEVKSITVGVNLDAQMRPEYAGVISVNSEKFKSGRMLDKILRLSFKNDAYTCIAPLTPTVKG